MTWRRRGRLLHAAAAPVGEDPSEIETGGGLARSRGPAGRRPPTLLNAIAGARAPIARGRVSRMEGACSTLGAS
eukprot:301944-Pyramimonas_sp.AAC.1